MTTRILRSFSIAAATLFLVAGLRAPAQTAASASTRPKAKAKPALVDINGAAPKEMASRLGIPEDLATKIAAGRPYGSKAHLVTHGIMSTEAYMKIKDKVIAKQPGVR